MGKTDQLSSWNDSEPKNAIQSFVVRVTNNDSPDFVPSESRVAVFDNDGTLWCEKPVPIQADFLLRKVGAMAKEDPSLVAKQPWNAVVEKDYAWLGSVIDKHYAGDDSDLKVMAAGLLQAYEGVNVDDYAGIALDFLQNQKHPKYGVLYKQCVFQPMLELLRYLEANGFTNYIVSGGGRDFMRTVSNEIYGIPGDRVIGSSAALEFEDDGETTTIVHKAELGIFDDGPVKPVEIWARLGQRPIFGAGNSNGDIQMLRYCMHPSRPSFGLLINHDDEEREYSYQKGAEESLKQADKYGWTVVSMKDDWTTVFAADSATGTDSHTAAGAK
jgi:FMN phosphatase YigB (HAD superfamily)